MKLVIIKRKPIPQLIVFSFPKLSAEKIQLIFIDNKSAIISAILAEYTFTEPAEVSKCLRA
jgi:hypothetical protein